MTIVYVKSYLNVLSKIDLIVYRVIESEFLRVYKLLFIIWKINNCFEIVTK